MKKPLVVAIDIGGTNAKLALADSSGRITARARKRMQQVSTKRALYEMLATIISSFIERAGVEGRVRCVGIGFAGLTDGGGGVVYFAPNIGRLSNIEIGSELEARLGLRVVVENDANCAVLGEYWQGAARGASSVFMFTLGTGIGGGLVINGNLWRGQVGIAGEIGHTIIDVNGPRCACGNRGCLEALASGTAIIRDYRQRKRLKSTEPLTARQVVLNAKRGDRIATSVVRHAGEALGIGIANVFNLINPELILIGGGVSRAGNLLLGPAVAKARDLVAPGVRKHLRVKRGRLGDDAGVLGAVYLGFIETGVGVS